MSSKFLFVFCVQSVFLQLVQSQCTRTTILTASPSTATPFSPSGCPEIITPAIEVTPTTGGALPVTCLSPFPEEPLTVASESAYEGTLSVNGELPFVGTVAVSGELPTAGTGAVNHACGNNVKITKVFSRPGIGNSLVPGNSIANKRGQNNAFVAPASPVASNLNSKRGLGSWQSNLGYTDSGVTGLGLVNGLGAAVGLGDARYVGTGIGNTAFGGAEVGNVAYSGNALGNVGFRGVGLGNIGYGVNTGYGGVGVTNAGYGGTGAGTVAVVGELPVAGTTVVVGQLPIVGAVYFSGNAPAFGTVTVSGSCSCDCNRYLY